VMPFVNKGIINVVDFWKVAFSGWGIEKEKGF